MWLEVPLPAHLWRRLASCVPRPLPQASCVGGPFRRARPSDAQPLLDAYLRKVCETFEACGWAVEGGAIRHADGRRHELVWPWEWTHATTDAATHAAPLLCFDGTTVRAARLAPEWAAAALEAFVHAPGGVSIFMAPAPRSRATIDDTDDLDHLDHLDTYASRVTDPARHALFTSLAGTTTLHARYDVEAPPTRFACHARMAVSTKNGVLRCFVPDADDLTALRAFAGADPSVLFRPPDEDSARRGGVQFTARPAAGSMTTPPEPKYAVINMTEADLCDEMGVGRAVLDAETRRAHGVLPNASCLCWPYRLALLRAIARQKNETMRYTEGDRGEGFFISPSGEALRHAMADASGCYIAWDGRRWGMVWYKS